MNSKIITESGILIKGAGILRKLLTLATSSGTLQVIDGTEESTKGTGVLTSAGACAPADYATQALTSDGTNFDGGDKSQGTITLTGIPTADETMVIGGTTYTFKAARSGAGEITIGADAPATVTNIVAAITADSTDVTAVDGAGDTVVVTAANVGTAGDAIVFTEAATNTAVDGAGTLGTTTAGANPETATIKATVYRFLATTEQAYDVKIGANAAATLDNLKLAINASGAGDGTDYHTGTLEHPEVIATTNTDTVQTIRAKIIGTAPNSYATTETCAHAAFGAATMASGVAVTNALITIGTRVYTAVLTLPETLGYTAVPDYVLWVTSEAVFLDNLKKAINESGTAGTDYSAGTLQNFDVKATTNTDTAQTIESRRLGSVQNDIATTETLANYSWGAVTLENGSGAIGKLLLSTYTPAAGDIVDIDISYSYGLYIIVGGTSIATVINYE